MSKRSHELPKSSQYVKLMNYTCANPDCDFGYSIEGHHINPISKGGDNKYWNLISLCKVCHHRFGHSRKKDLYRIELFTWKCMQELNMFGFTIDEKDKWFDKHINEARAISAGSEKTKAI